MSEGKRYDLLIQNVRLVRPHHESVDTVDVAVKDGRFADIGPGLAAEDALEVFDGQGLLAFPGVVDPHTHVGIYRHVSEDARTETAAAVYGGVTTMLTNFRAGSLYLNKGGPYHEFYPELLEHAAGNYYVDYGYNISPLTAKHITEMEYLLEQGVPTYKIFMFYGSHGLDGSSDRQHQWLMLDDGDQHDLAHFEFIMREAARLQEKYPEIADYISVSFHCEVPELLTAYEKIVRARSPQGSLKDYSDARPPHAEAMSIAMVGSLAHHTGSKNINILHITSREAMEAALTMRQAYPEINFGLESTAGHLLLHHEAPLEVPDVYGKVNPPIRSRADREYLWERVKDGTVQWIITDHANCPKDMKTDPDDPQNMWKARAGFGGIEYLLPGIFSEGSKRDLPLHRIAELLCWNPAQRFGLLNKGHVAPGYDADLALLDPEETWTIHYSDSPSTQGYTPFEGIEVNGRVKHTFLRGNLVFRNGEVMGPPRGEYQRRPTKGPGG